MIPYTTSSGLQIGSRYTPALPPIQGDAVRLQSALLDPRSASRPSRLGAFFGFFWRFM